MIEARIRLKPPLHVFSPEGGRSTAVHPHTHFSRSDGNEKVDGVTEMSVLR
jgi:hypothetical protein